MKLKLVSAMLLAGTLAFANCGVCGVGPGDKPGKEGKATGKFFGIFSRGPKEAGRLNTAALAALMATRTPMVIVDARPAKYDDGKRIPGAKSVSADSSDDEIKAMLPDKSDLIVAYCVNPECPASPQLAEKLRKMGYKNVVEYSEGIEGWQKAGHEVEKAERPSSAAPAKEPEQSKHEHPASEHPK